MNDEIAIPQPSTTHLEVDLDFPVTVNGSTVTSIRFRRMKGKDQLAIEKVSGSNTMAGFTLMSMLAVEPLLAPKEFGEFDAADLQKIDEKLRPFLGIRDRTSAVR